MNITVISTFAKDRLIYENTTIIRDGGPALYITDTLKKLRYKYDLITGPPAEVEIDMRDNKEQGKIIKVEKINLAQNFKSDFLIISTLLDELELDDFGDFTCLDIQGYVREGSFFGTKKHFDSLKLENIKIIKGTEEEIKYLSEEVLKKIPLVIITLGSSGFIIKNYERNFYFDVEKVYSSDTIGAGDTFFTAFCLNYYETRNIYQSAIFAKNIVSDFLKNKKGV